MNWKESETTRQLPLLPIRGKGGSGVAAEAV
jgi:hypothetical protein